MKNLFKLIIFIPLCFSCGERTNNQSGDLIENSINNSINNSHLIDSDLDGINDKVEIKNGTDPFVADIPNLSFNQLKLNLFEGQRALDFELGYKSWLGSYRNVLAKKIKRRRSSGNYSTSDYLAGFNKKFNLVCLSEKYSRDNLSAIDLKMSFKLINSSRFQETLISNVTVNDILVENNEKSSLSLTNIRLVDNCYKIESLDFNYSFGGETFSYEDQIRKFKNKLSHITLHYEDKNFEFYVVPGKINLSSLLKKVKGLALSSKDFHVFPSNKFKYSEPFERKMYSFALLKDEEIAKSDRKKKFTNGFINKEGIEFLDARVGDEISLELDASLNFKFSEDEKRFTQGWYFYKRGNATPKKRPDACVYEKNIQYDADELKSLQNNLSLRLFVGDDKREVLLTSAEGKLKTKYTLLTVDERKIEVRAVSQTNFYFNQLEKWSNRGHKPGKSSDRRYVCNVSDYRKYPIFKTKILSQEGVLKISYDLVHTTY